MYKSKDVLFSWFGSSTTIVLSFAQTKELLQIIQFIVGILCGLVTLAFTIYKWYNKAKEDGKITPDEVEELINIVGDGLDDVEREVEEYAKNTRTKGKD